MVWSQEKGSSIRIFKLGKFSIPKNLEIPPQKKVFEYSGETNLKEAKETREIGEGKTIIKFNEDSDKLHQYHICQYSDAIRTPIRVLIEDYQDWDGGFQEKREFNMIYDEGKNYLYLFTNTSHTNILLSRFSKYAQTYIYPTPLQLDFIELLKIPEVQNIWGIWSREDEGRVRTKAEFGPNLEYEKKVKEKLAKANAINLKIVIDGREEYDITLSKNCRISCKTPLTNKKLLEFFHNYFEKLIKS